MVQYGFRTGPIWPQNWLDVSRPYRTSFEAISDHFRSISDQFGNYSQEKAESLWQEPRIRRVCHSGIHGVRGTLNFICHSQCFFIALMPHRGHTLIAVSMCGIYYPIPLNFYYRREGSLFLKNMFSI